MIEWIEDREHLLAVQEEHEDFFALAFWGEFSEAAQRALKELEQFASEHEKVPVFVVDVQKVNGVHKDYGVESVPTVLAIEKGEVKKCLEGVQSARFYSLHLAGDASRHAGGSGESEVRRVIVYSGPGCPACGQAKNYLRQHGVAYREVDISRNQRAAEKLARRSGRMAVPQIDINGRLVVGFDRARLSRLLGIREEEKA